MKYALLKKCKLKLIYITVSKIILIKFYKGDKYYRAKWYQILEINNDCIYFKQKKAILLF